MEIHIAKRWTMLLAWLYPTKSFVEDGWELTYKKLPKTLLIVNFRKVQLKP